MAALGMEGRMAVVVRTDLTAAEVRELAKAAATPEQAGGYWRSRSCWRGRAARMPRAAWAWTARPCGRSRRDRRVHRFNVAGPAGLVERKAPGRQRRLSEAQLDALRGCLASGPDLAQDGVARWRLVDLCGLSAVLTSRRGIGRRPMVERRFGVRHQERGMGKLVAALGFSRISARPQHPRSAPEAQAEFNKNCPN